MAYLTWAKFYILSTGGFMLQSCFKWGSPSALIINCPVFEIELWFANHNLKFFWNSQGRCSLWKIKALKLDLLPGKFCYFSKILTLSRDQEVSTVLWRAVGTWVWVTGGEWMERHGDRHVLSAAVMGGDEQLFWKGGEKDSVCQGLEKLLVMLLLSFKFLENFWNEFQHKSICFSFIATFNTYIRKQYRKVRWVWPF